MEQDQAPSAADRGSELTEGLGLAPKRGLLTRLNSLKVLLGTDSPEVRGWAPVVQQNAQATVNAAIVALKQCGGDSCMGQRVQGVTQWVTEQAAEARVAAERERIAMKLRGMDCAHGCSIGEELAAIVRKA